MSSWQAHVEDAELQDRLPAGAAAEKVSAAAPQMLVTVATAVAIRDN